MKFLVLAACVAACNAAAINVGTGGYLGGGYVTGLGAGIAFTGLATGYAAGPLVVSAPYAAIRYGYSGPLNLNTQLIAHPNGAVVPVDEPAVAIARARHLISKGAAYAASAPIFNAAPLIASAPAVATAPIAVAAAPIAANVGYAYAGPLNLNTALQHLPNGAVVPIEEPAVAAARADHFVAQGAAFAAVAPSAAAAPLIAAAPVVDAPFVYSGPLNLNTELTAHPNGAVVPVDEPAVAIARAEHLASQGAALAAATQIITAAAPIFDASFFYAGPLNLNTELTAFPNGAVVPVDEPAVASARAEHLAAQVAALAAATPIVSVAAPLIAAAPALTAAPIVDAPFVYAGPLNLNTELTAFPNGAVVPVDEPAVARAEHLASQDAALAAATPIFGAAAPLIVAAPALDAAPIIDAPFAYAGPLNLNTELTAFPNGAVVPVDEPAVAFARAEHLDALSAATPIAAAPFHAAIPAVAAAPIVTAHIGYSGPLNLNTELFTHPNGAVVPIDEPAVAVARAEHLRAFLI